MSPLAKSSAPTVVVVDDDRHVCEALESLFRSVGLAVAVFESIPAYLARNWEGHPACIVLDVRLPGKSGLEFQQELIRANIWQPIVFLSGHADVAMSVRAMKAGAIEFLTKPVRDQELLDAVQLAIEHDRRRRLDDARIAEFRLDYATLTPRERDIMAHVVTGRRNKQIAAEVGVTEATVKLHRGSIFKKMRAGSLVELVRMADALNHQLVGRDK